MKRYALGLFGLIKSYCNWADSQAKHHTDLLLHAFGPLILLGLVFWSLAAWNGKTVALLHVSPHRGLDWHSLLPGA